MTGTGLVLLGIGGSATNDLGLGALEALGAVDEVWTMTSGIGFEALKVGGSFVRPVIIIRWPSECSLFGIVSERSTAHFSLR